MTQTSASGINETKLFFKDQGILNITTLLLDIIIS